VLEKDKEGLENEFSQQKQLFESSKVNMIEDNQAVVLAKDARIKELEENFAK